MLKLCKTCRMDNYSHIINPTSPVCIGGYIDNLIEECHTCPWDNCPNHKEGEEYSLIDINFSDEEFRTIISVSQNIDFLEAMIKLKQDDIIEYESRMSQFRTQVEQQNVAKKTEEQQSVPHCPACGSTNIKKISTTSKIGSVAMWGILSRKVHKQWHCNQCKSEW